MTDRVAKEGCCFVNIGLKAECLVKRTIKPGWSMHNLHTHIFLSHPIRHSFKIWNRIRKVRPQRCTIIFIGNKPVPLAEVCICLTVILLCCQKCSESVSKNTDLSRPKFWYNWKINFNQVATYVGFNSFWRFTERLQALGKASGSLKRKSYFSNIRLFFFFVGHFRLGIRIRVHRSGSTTVAVNKPIINNVVQSSVINRRSIQNFRQQNNLRP